MIKRIEIPFPLGGISDRWSNQNIEPFKTVHALNMRSLDPVSGRKRGAQRSGTSKFISVPIGASFVQDVISVVNDVRLATYTARTTSPSIEWQKQGPANHLIKDMAVTLGGDIFAISGVGTLVKYNSSGTKIFEVQLPLTFDDEVAKSISLDTDGGIFISTETTAERYAGKIFRYEPRPTDSTRLDLIWTRVVDARIPSISYRAGILYVIENRILTTTLRALGELSTDVPITIWEKPVPNPSAQVTVNKAGDILVASPPNPVRDDVVIPDFCGIKSVEWTPDDLSIGQLRSWHRADQLVDLFVDNEVVDFWIDSSLSSRNMQAATQGQGPVGDGNSPPTYGGKYVENAICGKPGIRFDTNRDSAGIIPGMTSGVGDFSLFPPGNTAYFMTMIFKSRPQPSNDGSDHGGKVIERGGTPYFTLRQSVTGKFFHGEITDPVPFDNTGPGGSAEPIDGSHGQVRGQPDDTPVPHGRTGGMHITNEGDIAIITIAFDPHSDPLSEILPGQDPPAEAVVAQGLEGSFFRLNGSTDGIYTDQFTLGNFSQADATRFAYTVWGPQRANIDLCEVVVFQGDYQWPGDFTESGAPSGSSGSSGTAPPADWPGEPASGAGVSEMEKVEGYLAHKYGVQSILHASHPFASSPPTGESGSESGPSESDLAVLKSPDGIISKYSSVGGAFRWGISGPGLGHAVVTDDDDGVYSTGPAISMASGASSGVSPAEETNIRKIIDEGFSVSEDESSGVGAWTYTNEDPLLFGFRMAVDSEKNLYVPVNTVSAGSTLFKFDASGLLEWTYLITPIVSLGYCCVTDTITTDFGDDSIGEPEFLYLGVGRAFAGQDLDTIYKLRLVDVSVVVGAPRENIHLAVCEGNIRKMVPGGSPEVATVIDGASGDFGLNTGSRIVASVFSQGKVYYVDGENYRVYDPDKNTASKWISTGAGTLPKRAKIVVEWNGRIVLARTEGEPHNMYFSEVGNPNGWDLFPPVLTATSAFAMATSQAGPVPDTVNCLIAYSDNQLIIGGDRSIHVLVGDPLAGALSPARGSFPSGQMRLVTDSIGMAFGTPWCKDEAGNVYFFGSRGGVYRMIPGNTPEKISSDIDKRIKKLDLNYFTARMEWNDQDRGLHLFFVPIDVVPAASGSSSGASSGSSSGAASGAPSGGVEPTDRDFGGPEPVPGDSDDAPTVQATAGEPLFHWFWFEEDRSWWSDRFPTEGQDPTATTVADGDEPSDRVMLLGCADGYVRFWDDTTPNDDGLPITAQVTIGPIRPKNNHDRLRYSAFEIVLASDQDGASARLFRSDEADNLGEVVAGLVLLPGRNPAWRRRVRGQSVYIQLFNETLDERFAFESMGADVSPSGRVR